jgi:two-component system, NtrC family, sensor histidine kinase HydH
MASHLLPRLARWGALTATVLMAAALLATVWSTHAGVRDASQLLERGQSDLLERELRLLLQERDAEVTSALLAEVLAELEPSGLRYIAAVERSEGRAAQGDRRRAADVVAEAGEPLGRRALDRRRRGALGAAVPVGDRLRTVHRVRAPRPPDAASRRSPRVRRVQLFIVEYEPIIARDLRARSARNLAIGGVAAGVFLIAALALGRWLIRRERFARERERERRLASLGEMSAVLAHEIRNPLASLKGNSQLLVQMIPEGERARQKAERVVGEAVRLEGLTADLLEFVRTGALHPSATEPAALLRECAEAVDPSIEVDTAQAPRVISIDGARMRQAITNLLDNAVAAGHPVRLRAEEARGGLGISVRDHGEGIAPGDEERIFEPFTTRRAQGTGLGLAVARRIVELHDGVITARNHPDGGAEFRLWIPGRGGRGRA